MPTAIAADADHVSGFAVLRVLALDEDTSRPLPLTAWIRDVSKAVALPAQWLELVALPAKGALQPLRDLLLLKGAALLRAHALQTALHLPYLARETGDLPVLAAVLLCRAAPAGIQ